MGLFSKKKKPSASDEAAAQAARAQAAAAQASAAQAAKEAQARAAANTKKSQEERTLANITAKRTDIKQLQRALDGFDEERRREAGLAIKAKNEKKINVAKAHMRNAARLKQRIAQYETRIVQNQTQLDALEDTASNVQAVDQMQDFNQNMQGMQQDPDQINDTLQNMRDVMDGVNDVNLTLQADAQLNKGIYDTDDVLGDLAELEAEFADDTPVQQIPSVPGEVPKMPTAAAPAASEEEEIRRLEADIGI